MQKGKVSDERRKIIKTGAKTFMVAAAMTQFGGLMGTLDAAIPSSEEKADLIYINGKVYTVDDKKAWAEAFAVKNRRFIAVGTNKEMEKLRGKKTKMIDLKDHFVMPGLIDDHIHPDMGADNYLNVFIKTTDNWETIIQKIKDYRKNNPNKKWIFGSSIDWLLDDNGIIKNYNLPSNKSILDKIVDDRPVALWDQGAHAMLLNTKALEALNITEKTPNPAGGMLIKDKSGKLTGVIRETATTLVINALDNFSLADWTKKGMQPFLNELNSYGITALSDAYVVERNAQSFASLEKTGTLNLWINLYMATPLEFNREDKKKAQYDFIVNSAKYKTEQISPAGVKYLLDGAAAGKTAAMLKPFEGTDILAPLRYPKEKIETEMKKFAKMGYAMKSHAIGDRAIRILLDIYQELPKREKELAMNSIAHSVFPDPSDIARYEATNTVYEASPAIWFPTNAIPIIEADIGKERLSHAWPIKKMIENNTIVSYGSDWVVSQTPNPWPGIEGMITRQVPGGSKDAFVPDAAVDLPTALKIVTLNGAISMGISDKTGSIEKNKSADFIVLDKNPFDIDTYQIHNIKVLSTVFRGSEIYTLKR
ncbi:amidohydrolase [Hydrogenimonas cancrithermarum]|uniref:Amidohydrolase 3 domain-containing protein n=1 Tax=Hydrogenimonas cancrithermarum TaxID=2993563 RepID=A0ABN6WRX4_9BACT|nr:amidohydrolase [Hydrogenimonas cancrithermarum]BDY11900.1 hypothetical protein HCR_02120 [Hydrogenimonas cancrithermarum]